MSGLDARYRIRNAALAAFLALVTLTLYGFWWWYDINRQLHDLGQRRDPWRSLADVTIGWILLLPPFFSIAGTTRRIAAVQHDAELSYVVRPWLAIGLAVVATAGLPLYVLTGENPAALVVTAVFGMLFVAYLQYELNLAVAGARRAQEAPGAAHAA